MEAAWKSVEKKPQGRLAKLAFYVDIYAYLVIFVLCSGTISLGDMIEMINGTTFRNEFSS